MQLLASVMAYISFTASPSHYELICPEYIETRQTLATPVPGWSASQNRNSYFEGKVRGQIAGFSFGPPEQMAMLKPDSEDGAKVDEESFVQSWSLGGNSTMILAVCRYAGTTIQLAKHLPGGLKKCSIQQHRSAGASKAWCE